MEENEIGSSQIRWRRYKKPQDLIAKLLVIEKYGETLERIRSK